MPGTAAPPDPTRPFRWTKRLVVAALIGFAAVIGLRLVWGQVLAARVAEQTEAIRAIGEPADYADIPYTPLSSTENGAVYCQQALTLWPNVPGSATQRVTDTNWYLEGLEAGYPDPISDNAAYLAACQPAHAVLRAPRRSYRHAGQYSGTSADA